MHKKLDCVWRECWRVLKPGALACINIGDATRKVGAHFALYANHARIQTFLLNLGFMSLPAIIWRKQTNAPNKFMGSGMLPPGAYVTLEHEYILIVRKGGLRQFASPSEKASRRASAFFWEERNVWFSDIWMDLKGTTQKLGDHEARKRSGAFPFELPYRLISMFSVKEDRVLDPFLGLGTTMLAAMAAGRNSIGYEIDARLEAALIRQTPQVVDVANRRIGQRLADHLQFVNRRCREKKPLKHTNAPYGFPVVTKQETQLLINALISVTQAQPNLFCALHSDSPQKRSVRPQAQSQTPQRADKPSASPPNRRQNLIAGRQQPLF
jgi:DNA modification methylase